MRLRLRAICHVLGGLVLFFLLGFSLSGSAFGSQLIAVRPIPHIASQSLVAEQQRFEQQFPKGSRIYYIDQYLIKDGFNYAIFPIESSFLRDRYGLHATSQISGTSETFSLSSTVTRQMNTLKLS